MESLLIDACSFFDSLCQTFIREKSADGYNFAKETHVSKFTDKVRSRAEFTFGDYRQLLEADFRLSERKVNLNPYEEKFYSNPIHFHPDAISGYLIAPFQEWAGRNRSPWWKAFTSLKHDRISSFRSATVEGSIYALAAVFILLTLHNKSDFKEGKVPLEVYDVFFPKYWTFKGRVSVMNFMWS
jgi:hypothetical protein